MMALGASHERVRAMLGPYVLDGLEQDERADVEGHLSDCGEFRESESKLRRTATELRSRRCGSPSELWSRIERLVSGRDEI